MHEAAGEMAHQHVTGKEQQRAEKAPVTCSRVGDSSFLILLRFSGDSASALFPPFLASLLLQAIRLQEP